MCTSKTASVSAASGRSTRRSSRIPSSWSRRTATRGGYPIEFPKVNYQEKPYYTSLLVIYIAEGNEGDPATTRTAHKTVEDYVCSLTDATTTTPANEMLSMIFGAGCTFVIDTHDAASAMSFANSLLGSTTITTMPSHLRSRPELCNVTSTYCCVRVRETLRVMHLDTTSSMNTRMC